MEKINNDIRYIKGIINILMKFEFDPGNSVKNKKKHGINFEEAVVLWDDIDLLEIPIKTSDEPRFLVAGKILEKHWSAIITFRSDKTRIISARRARKEEIDLYDS